jgi:GNAT superfamily N-acetyltransferase
MTCVKLIYEDDKILIADTYYEIPYKSISDLHMDCFDTPFPKNELVKIQNAIDIYVLYDESTLIGMFWIVAKTTVMYISTFCISKEYQRRGIGSKLFEFMRKAIYTLEFHNIVFDSHVNDVAFYRKVGCQSFDAFSSGNSVIWAVKSLPCNVDDLFSENIIQRLFSW